jgi:hypothetical protein
MLWYHMIQNPDAACHIMFFRTWLYMTET